MKKPIMKWTAVLLAVIMAVMPVSSSYAAGSVSDAAIETGVTLEDVANEETQETVTSEEILAEEVTEESPAEEDGEAVEEEPTTEESPAEENDEVAEEESSMEESPEEEGDVIEEETTTEEEDVTESEEEEVTEEEKPDETVSGNEAEEAVSGNEAEEAVSGNEAEETVSGNEAEETVSGNDADKTVSENDAEPVFPGMGKNYVMTAKQIADKVTLGKHLGEMDDLEEGKNYVPGELIYSTDSAEEAQMVADAYGATLKSYFDGVAVIGLPENVSVSQAVHAAANARSNLPAAYPNYYRYLYTEDMGDMQVSSVMNDANLSAGNSYHQWQHYAVGTMYAWDAGYTGQGVKVAVIDSGVAVGHEDISAVYNYDVITQAQGSADDDASGHGTHVAGIIAANGNNNVGGSGIAPDAQIYNLKVFDDDSEGSGSAATITRAINHAVTNNVDIINMSLGGIGYTEAEHTAIINAVNKGIAVFVAAGNDGARTKCYPAAFEESICVAATGTNNEKASFSNYGDWVDLCAPGVDIYSTYPTSLNGIGYEYMSGTSQATPVTAGVAAVILSANLPELAGKTGSAKVAALKSLMEGNVKESVSKEVGKGITYLPLVFGMVDATAKPGKPQIDLGAGTYKETGKTTTISVADGFELWYSVNGKTPSLKNGEVVNGTKAEGTSLTLELDKIVNEKNGKVTVKAIAVNKYSNVASSAASASYTLKPPVAKVTVTGATKNVPVKKSLTLKAAVTPAYAENKKVVWTITKEDGSSVAGTGVSITQSGVVKTTKQATPGTYKVTATPKDGKGGTPGEYTVTVAGAQIKSIKFKPASFKLEMGSEAATLELSTYMEAKKIEDSAAEATATATDFIWSSSKPAVATVDENGKVTTVGAGTTKITALAADGSGVKKTCSVTVTQLATGITITQPVDKENTNTVLLAAGKSVTLKANVSPATTKNKAVTWEISPKDQGVSVNKSGKVTANKNAAKDDIEYIVKATAKDGSETYDEIKVKVYKGVATKVTLQTSDGVTMKKATIFRKSTGYRLPTSVDIKVVPTGATGQETAYTVTSSNEKIVKVTKNGGTVTASAAGIASGTATVKVVMNDGSGKSATCKITVKNPLSGLSIAPEAGKTEHIMKGKKLKLSAILEEEYGKASRKLKWSVETGKEYASVNSSGVVTAKKEFGSAVIKVETTDGSGICARYLVYTWKPTRDMALFPEGYAEADGYKIFVVDVGYNPFIEDDTLWYVSWYDAKVCPEIDIEVDNPEHMRISHNDNGYFLVYLTEETASGDITVKAMDGSGKKAVLKAEELNEAWQEYEDRLASGE